MKLKEILLKRLEKETIYEDGFGEKSVTEVIEQVFKEAESKQFYITDVVKSLPTKEDIKLKAKEETSFSGWVFAATIQKSWLGDYLY